mmetsp:Transcript_4878/g.6612  ORF Transcript_4878/g.6612 Transcript_4878/m.6612 type:complete len:369 (-) Transcript_4878:48-1154(-)
MREDESRRKVEKPQVFVSVAIEILKAMYGFTAFEDSIKELNSYDDRNFLVSIKGHAGESPSKYILKVHNGVDSQNVAFIEAQNAALQHLASCSLPCPVCCPALDNSFISWVPLPLSSGVLRTHAVRLLSYIPGDLMADQHPSGELISNVGGFLGDLSCALQSFSHRGLVRQHMWDLTCSLQLRDFVGCIPDESRRKMVQDTLNEFELHVLPLAASLRRAVVHNDANDQNILVDFNSHTVVGLLDFGDMLETWQVSEVAIAAAYVMLGPSVSSSSGCEARMHDPVQAASVLIQAYCKVFPLTEIEVSILPTLVMCRLCCSLTLGAFSHQQDPTNAYLLLTQEPGWKVMQVLRSIGSEGLRQNFRKATDL